jgi:hypothetical protein
MAFESRILADSINDETGDRLTTWLSTYPRMIHGEMMTNKMHSKSSASSRAIPVGKMLANIEEDPVVPIWWGKNEPGMQAYAEVEDKAGAEAWWREGIASAIAHARKGVELGLHKQIVNRVVESGMWISVIYSATTVSNLYGLRIHEAAEPHCRKIVVMMKEAQEASTPKRLKPGQWHLPLIFDEDYPLAADILLKEDPNRSSRREDFERDVTDLLVKVSVGRCARVSYLTHEGKRDLVEDVKLHDKLLVQVPLHAAPGEHVAQTMAYPAWFKKMYPDIATHTSKALNISRMESRAMQESTGEINPLEIAVEAALAQIQSGNFRGWRQYRKLQKNEHIGEPMP